MPLLVKDMLKRPYFKNTQFLAGKNGIGREIKWVHIVEIAKFGHLLNGSEVILSTGIGWANNEEKSLAYLQQLLDYNAAALCVELAVPTNGLPKKMLELANEHDFPIISFMEEVRFIDITKDLHELLLGYHEDIWWKLETLHNKLNSTLTTNGTAGDFLKILHQETNKQVILFYDDQYRFFPAPAKKEQERLIASISKGDRDVYHSYSIHLLNKKIAALYLLENKQTVTQFDELSLKRCGDILAQYFWKHHQQLEKQQMEKNEWILEAIADSKTHEEIMVKIQQETPGIITREAIIGVKPYQQFLLAKDKDKSIEAVLFMQLRTTLLHYGFQLFTIKDTARSQYILLLINQQTDPLYNRLYEALQTIHQQTDDPFIHQDLGWLSFGKVVSDYTHLGVSYKTALSTLYYQQKIEKLEKPFYCSLGVYRLVDLINDRYELNEVVIDYIQPILRYDEENGTELLKTLQAYLENLGSKNETAKTLHIVRQTLYHRLSRIEELLGQEFMAPGNRLMIEFSIHALKYRKTM